MNSVILVGLVIGGIGVFMMILFFILGKLKFLESED